MSAGHFTIFECTGNTFRLIDKKGRGRYDFIRLIFIQFGSLSCGTNFFIDRIIMFSKKNVKDVKCNLVSVKEIKGLQDSLEYRDFRVQKVFQGT